MIFATRAKIIEGPTPEGFFPDTFSNEVYLSVTRCDTEFKPYVSPFSIKYIVEGTESYIINRKRYNIKKGEVLVVNEGSETVSIIEKKQEDNIGASIFIDAELMSEVYSDLIGTSNEIDPEAARPKHFEFFDNIRYSRENERLNYLLRLCTRSVLSSKSELVIDASFYFMIAKELLVAHYNLLGKLAATGKVKPCTQKEIYRRILLAMDYLEANASKAFSLAELAHVACLSKFNLIRNFKSISGVTPQQFHFKNRIRLATSLLQTHTVTETALACGYPDVHSFSKQFKLFTGISPSRY